MILFDNTTNDSILIDDIKVNSSIISNINSQLGSNIHDKNITITLNIKHLNYVENWISDTHNQSIKKKYARDIFITGKIDMKFTNCFIVSYSRQNIQRIELDLSFDYSEIGGNFPELKAIYRDRKIEELLNS